MSQEVDPISVVKYDEVARLLADCPELSHSDVADACGVAETTVGRIWSGSISRPPVIVLDRLPQPKRCPDCGGLCRDWPCIFCEMKRRRLENPEETPRFQYRRRSK